MAIKPMDDRVLVEPLEAEETTPGGIVLPDNAKEKPMRGKVVATGPGALLENGKRAEMVVKKGDQVIYGKYSGTEIKVKGTDYMIIRASELLAKVE